MDKRSKYPQMIDVDICECGSERITCKDSRYENGIRYRRKKCLDCGRVFYTREIEENEWQRLMRFKQHIEAVVKEISNG